MKTFPFLFLLFISMVGSAQVRTPLTISGKVIDALNGQPLPGASIHLTDARLGVIADSTGFFLLKKVPAGHHLIEVSHSGYHSLVEHVDMEGNLQREFALAPAIVENQGVTVTGVTTATSTRNVPIPVTLIRKTELLQSPSVNIIDALTRQPGISQISTGASISKPVIRGLGYNRVVVINDGIRQEGQQWGDEHGIEIDELSVQRVEIIKGPASLIYGSDALAGVMHFITNVPQPEGSIKGNIYTGYQSNNKQFGVNGNVAGNLNGWNWNVYGSQKSAQDYKNRYDGRVLNSRFNEGNFGGYFGLNKSWGYSHLLFSSFNQNVGLVEGDRDAVTGEFLVYPGSALERIATAKDQTRDVLIPYQHIQHNKIISDNSVSLGKSRIKFNLGYQNNLRQEFGDPENPRAAELFFDLKTLNYNLQWRLPEMNELELTIGANGMYQSNENKGEEVIIPEYNLFDAGMFGFLRKTINNFTLSGGLRIDHRKIHSEEFEEGNELKFSSFNKSFANISGSAGFSFHPSDKLVLKANIARGFRAPSLPELASNGAHEGTSRYEYGQLSLKSEKSLQLDAGIDVDQEHVSFSLSGFYNNIRDFIFYQRLQNSAGNDSIILVDNEPLEAFQYSQNNAILWGGEFLIDLHPHPLDWLHFENSFSFVRGMFNHDIDGSKNLPMIPAPRWMSEIRVNLMEKTRTAKNSYLRIEMEKTFQQKDPFTGYNTETVTDGYALINAGAGTDFFRKDRLLMAVHLSVNNIADKAYQSHLSRLKYAGENAATGRRGVYQMGRNFSVKISVPFVLRSR